MEIPLHILIGSIFGLIIEFEKKVDPPPMPRDLGGGSHEMSLSDSIVSKRNVD